jgi:hypothetical protein
LPCSSSLGFRMNPPWGRGHSCPQFSCRDRKTGR